MLAQTLERRTTSSSAGAVCAFRDHSLACRKPIFNLARKHSRFSHHLFSGPRRILGTALFKSEDLRPRGIPMLPECLRRADHQETRTCFSDRADAHCRRRADTMGFLPLFTYGVVAAVL